MIRHDRSVINAYGGIWPALADHIRAAAKAVKAGEKPVVPNRRGVCVRGDLRLRREALGLSSRDLAKLADCASSTLIKFECYGEGGKAALRIEAALALAEAERG